MAIYTLIAPPLFQNKDMKSIITNPLGFIECAKKDTGYLISFQPWRRFGFGLGLLACCSFASGQQIINLDVVVGANHPSNSLPVFTGQGVLGAATNNYWNGFQGGLGGMYGLLDSLGQPTAISVLTWGYPNPIGPDNTWTDLGTNGTAFYTTNTLLGNYVFTTGSYICVSINGLATNASYNLVCYAAPDHAVGTVNYTGGWTATCKPTTRNGYILGNNYVQGTNITSDTNGVFCFTIGPNAVFNGLQIRENTGTTNSTGNSNGVGPALGFNWDPSMGRLTLSWTNGVLESTPALQGNNTVWSPVSTNSPFSLSLLGKIGNMFFRAASQ